MKDSSRRIDIYALRDPRNMDEMRYIGYSNDPTARLRRGHETAARNGVQDYRCNWIRSLWKAGVEPELVILEEGPVDYDQAEKNWIHIARALGHRLTNDRPGGRGGVAYGNKYRLGTRQSIEARAKISESLRHRIHSAETRAKYSAIHKGKIVSDETRAKISATLTGRQLSPETRAKLKGKPAWNKGKKGVSEETRAKMSAAKKGKPPANKGTRTSPEIRRKISESVQSAMARPEVRARYLAGLANRDQTGEKHPMYGKHHTEETRAKISASKKGQLVGEDNHG